MVFDPLVSRHSEGSEGSFSVHSLAVGTENNLCDGNRAKDYLTVSVPHQSFAYSGKVCYNVPICVTERSNTEFERFRNLSAMWLHSAVRACSLTR